MILITSLVLSLIFPLVWLYFFLKEDPHPEPLTALGGAFVVGILAGLVAYFIEFELQSILAGTILTIQMFYLVLVEELTKFLFFLIFFAKSKFLDEPIDAMIYLLTIGLGFASFENFIYYQVHLGELFNISLVGSLLGLGFARFLGANFIHLATGVMMGFGYSIGLTKRRLLPIIISIAMAIFLHTLYNLFVMSKGIELFAVVPLIWVTVLIILQEFEIIKLNHGS